MLVRPPEFKEGTTGGEQVDGSVPGGHSGLGQATCPTARAQWATAAVPGRVPARPLVHCEAKLALK